MKLETYQYIDGNGWNTSLDTTLDSPQTLLLFFCSPDTSIVTSELESIRLLFPQSVMLGCSSAGEIFDDDVYDKSISLSIVQFEDTKLKLTTEQITDSNNSQSAGQHIARSLNDENLRSILVLSDGLSVNGTKLIAGLSSELPSNVVITGGLAGDGDRFKENLDLVQYW